MFEIGKLYKFIAKTSWCLVNESDDLNILTINFNDVVFVCKDIEAIDQTYKVLYKGKMYLTSLCCLTDKIILKNIGLKF